MGSRETPILQTRWWSRQTVAVVTGGNKGIGFEIVKQLSEQGLRVVLTSRDAGRGQDALNLLHSQGHNQVLYRRLDVADPSSIHNFVLWTRETLGGLDILVNNAGVSFGDELDHVEAVIQTNFYGPKLLTESLLPMFRSGSRILNISSRLGLVNKVRNPVVKKLLSDEEQLSMEVVEGIVKSFVVHAKQGRRRLEDEGWPKVWPSYSVSKLALNAYSAILARRLRDDHRGGHEGICVNCFCPGFTMTNMTNFKGGRTASSAARYAVQILLLPKENLPTGKFFVKDQPIPQSKL